MRSLPVHFVTAILVTLSSLFVSVSGVSRDIGHKPQTVDIVNDCAQLKHDVNDVNSAFKEQIPFSNVVHVNDSVRVILSGSHSHLKFKKEDQYYCKVAFRTHETGYRILLSWEYFSVGEQRNSFDWFQVVDLQSGLPLSDEMWGVMGEGTATHRPPPTNDYHSIGHGLVLNYKGHPYDDAVAVILTVFRDLNADNSCHDGYMKCYGNFRMCISEALHCNDDNNCGDSNRSDEEGCETNPWINHNSEPPVSQSSTPVGLIGALCGIFVTAVLIATIGLLVCWYKRRRHQRRFEKSSNPPRSIESLAQNGRVPVSNNTYTQLPTNGVPKNPHPDHCVMDFSNHSDVSPITLDGDSSESLLRAPQTTDIREAVTFNRTTPGEEPVVRYTNQGGGGAPAPNGACGNYGPDGQIYYYMDDICPVYQHVS